MPREHVSRQKLLATLPDAGAPGVTIYALDKQAPDTAHLRIQSEIEDEINAISAASSTGTVLFARENEFVLVVPPFVVEEAVRYDEMYTRPLVDLLQRERTIGVFLLRLGGFTAGVFRTDYLVDSKTDRRFVKNRHRKGGQSQRRFDRIREKQVHLLFEKACGEAREKLEPYDDEIEHVFLGGDRLTLLAFRKECSYFERYGARLMSRILPVAGDPRRATLDVMPREVWSSDIYRWSRDVAPDDRA